MDLHEYLAALPDLGSRPQGTMRSADFTLDRIEALMSVLGHPDRKYPSIHVAGTNGKGSVVAFCAAVLQVQGYKVGTFTSPHLAGALAGIKINQLAIAGPELDDTFQAIVPQLEPRQDWTQFEVVTALAFLHFARAKVDAAVIEVGLGGRTDATNVLTPLVSVITPIDYDHTSILGRTLAEIAREKAGIIKEGVPVVIAPQSDEARESILHVAREKHASVIEVGKDVRLQRLGWDLNGQEFEIWNQTPSPTPSSPPHSLRSGQAPAARSGQALPLDERRGALQNRRKLEITMLGKYQIENAATAFAALQVANQRGLEVSEHAIRRGFVAARWPGRFELLQTTPPVVLDSAHTPAAAKTLLAALDEDFPGRPIILVFGMSVDKNLSGIIAPLRQRVKLVITTQSPHARAVPANELGVKIAQLGLETDVVADARQAVLQATKQATRNEVVLIFGSVFLTEFVHDAFSQAIG